MRSCQKCLDFMQTCVITEAARDTYLRSGTKYLYLNIFELRCFSYRARRLQYTLKSKHASVLGEQPCLTHLAKEALPVRSLCSTAVSIFH